jgi:basic amino acid/polyamine antiporter, APA family
VVVATSFLGGAADLGTSTGLPTGTLGVLQSAGLLFFAFAGYARLATLGEEVRDPTVTIPRAIPLALGMVVTIYAVVLLGGALLTVGPGVLAIIPRRWSRSSRPAVGRSSHPRCR